MALLAVAEDVVEPIRLDSEFLMQVVGLGRTHREALVEAADARPRDWWITDAPPSSLYRASSRKVCRHASPITAAPDSTVRRPAGISVSTSIRFRSRSLIWISSIP